MLQLSANKVFNWIVPVNEDDDIRNEVLETRKFNSDSESDRASTPSFGSATSVLPNSLEPDKNSVGDPGFEPEDNFPFDTSENHTLVKSRQATSKRNSLSSLGEANFGEDSGDEAVDLPDRSQTPHSCKKTLSNVQPVVPDIKKVKRSSYTQTDRKSSIKLHQDGTGDFVACGITEHASQSHLYSDAKCASERHTDAVSLFISQTVQANDTPKRGSSDSCVYGELIVLGCNGSAPNHLMGQMDSKYVLRKRPIANGVKAASNFVAPPHQRQSHLINKHTISYHISGSRSVVVEYVRDIKTDMFQIGRFDASPVDFKVLDMNRDVGEVRNGVSRFACRIVVERHGNHTARVYAAAFDATGRIFLGENAITCVHEGKMDGFTTNGVLIMHPQSQPYAWREVSVCGFIYPVRSPNVEHRKRPLILEESNILQDGTLIDLCGVTLVWRSPFGLKNTPKQECLKTLEFTLQKFIPEFVLQKRPLYPERKEPKNEIFVFLSCGHIAGLRVCEKSNSLEGWSCPLCRTISVIAKLKIGKEPGLYVDCDLPTHAFRPCGHVATLKTVRFWSSIKILKHRDFEDGFCPFCGTKLSSISPKYVELKYPE